MRVRLGHLLAENGAPTRPTLQMHDGWALDTSMTLPHLGRVLEDSDRIIAERGSSDIEIVAVNDLAADDKLAHLLKYDTVFGRFPGKIVVKDGYMSAGGHTVKMLEERDPAQLPWVKYALYSNNDIVWQQSRLCEVFERQAGNYSLLNFYEVYQMVSLDRVS